MTVSIIDPLLEFALAGLGVAAFPDFMVEEHIAAGRLVGILDGALDRASTLNILWPASRHRAPKTRVFVDFMHEWTRRLITEPWRHVPEEP